METTIITLRIIKVKSAKETKEIINTWGMQAIVNCQSVN